MKQIITILLIATMLTSCKQGGGVNVTPAQVTIGATVATAAALRFAVDNDQKRTAVANLADYIAKTCYAVSNNPSPDQLAAIINQNVPQNIKSQYPELVALMVPIVISTYTVIYNQHKDDAQKVYAYLQAIALGVQTGASSFISH